MNEQPRRTLRELVARHGDSVVHDARRCEGLLKDYSGSHRREVSVLVSAVEEHIPRDMLAAPAGTPREVLLTRMARRLTDQRALSEQAARWAVESWALALGLISEHELKAPEGQGAPHVEDGGVDAGRGGAVVTAPGKISAPAPVVVSARGGGDFASIAEALRAVAPGARVHIRPGLYDESIVLDKGVVLVGDGAREEIVIKGVGASCLRADADAVVRGLTLRGAAVSDEAFFAVEVTGGRLLIEDCDISSDTLSCVAVHGVGAAPVIRNCRIHHGADSGLYFFDGAAGTVEHCEVYGHANVGVAVTGGAVPTFRRSSIHGGANAGLVAWQGGRAEVEECQIYGNRGAGLGVSEGARVTARGCRLHGGENSAVYVHQEGEAVLEECELYGHREAQAAVTTGGRLFLNGCRLRGGRDSGVFVRDGGQALLQTCEVSGHAGAGASVGAGSVLAVLKSLINGNARSGVEVTAGATARVEGSDLTGNGLGPWDVEEGAEVEVGDNRED